MVRVSVIMPSLNVAGFIDECVKSVRNQTLEELEILCIDAGSTDGTETILKRHCKEDARVRMITSDIKSYGHQINMGLDAAQGEYIAVVETDDLIAEDMFEKLYEIAERQRADYVKGAHVDFYADYKGEVILLSAYNIAGKPISGEYIMQEEDAPEVFTRDIFLWKGIYRRDFLENIRLNETRGAAFQDQGFLLQTISSAKKAVYVDDIGYYYRRDNDGASTYNTNGFRYIFEEYSLNEKYLAGKSKAWHTAFYTRMAQQCINRFLNMGKSGRYWEEAEEDICHLQEKLKTAIVNEYLTGQNVPDKLWNELQQFIEKPRELFEAYSKLHQNKMYVFDKVLAEQENRPVVIFGAGKIGQFVYDVLKKKAFDRTLCFCDNKEEVWNTGADGVMVMSPEEACTQFPEAFYVLAGEMYALEMQNQLKECGIPEEQIVTYTHGRDFLIL